MKKTSCALWLLGFMLGCIVPAEAATRQQPAYLETEMNQHYPWHEGLNLKLNIDEKICRQRYGEKWYEACRVYLGEEDKEIRGVTMTPPAEGRWTWRNGTTLHFTPAKALQPDTSYSISLEQLRLPASVRLNEQITYFHTMKKAAMLQNSRLWIDPSDKKAHVLTASLHFTYPVAEGTHLPVFDIPADSHVQLGPTEYVWNESRDELTLSAPVKELPLHNTHINLNVPGVVRFAIDNEGYLQFSKPDQDNIARFAVEITGQQHLFSVEKMHIVATADKNLNQGYELQLNTSLHARPDDILKKLSVVQLPEKLDDTALKPYNWLLAPSLPPSALKRAKKLHPVSLQPDNEPTSRMSFRLDADPKSYVLVFLAADATSATGLPLTRQWRDILYVSPQQAALRFLQPGNILPLKGSCKLDLYSTDVDEIRWQVSRIRDPFLALAAAIQDFNLSESNAGWAYDSLNSTAVVNTGVLPVTGAGGGKACFSTLDLSPLLHRQDDGTGLMMLSLQGYKGDEPLASVQRMVLVTDMAIISKRSATGDYDVFVSSLHSGKPASKVWVAVLGANGRPVATGRTDAQGHVHLPSLHGLSNEQRPVAITASAGSDIAWLPLNDADLVADYSSYAVSGRSLSPEGLSSFVFAQRGMFRPGETLHFGIVTRRADWKPLPEGLPLTARLYAPSGREVLKRTLDASGQGLAEVNWNSSHDSPTGRYRLDIELQDGQVLGSASVRVEEFQPDTMALKARMADKPARGWYRSNSPLAAEAQLSLMNGMPAVNHQLRADLRVMPATLHFKGYEDYLFHDALPFKGHVTERSLAAVTTDNQGKAQLPVPADLLSGATMRCTFLLEGMEADGGRAVSTPLSVLISPLDYMLGWKTVGAATNPEFLPQGRAASFDFIAVDSDLQRIDTGTLKFTVYNRRYVTSLVTDGRGEYRYDETPLDSELSSSEEIIPASGTLRWSVPTDKAGEYLLAVRDKDTTLALIPFTVAGERLALKDDGLASGILRLKTDNTQYSAGDTVKLFLQLPYDGSGLITLERDKVESSLWFSAKAGDTVQSIRIPDDFEGKAFVNVSYIRSASSPDIYAEPEAVAVAPIAVNIRQRNMGLQLSVPESLRPAETLKVRLSARHKGMAAVFAVDEGVLQLTGFTTPSPLHYLLEDRALDVRTIHALKRLMPDHSRLQGRIPAFGGGMGALNGRFHNPFRRPDEPPLSTWKLVEVGPEEQTVEIPVPAYYNGRVRIMAVGAAAQTVGSTSGTSVVAAPLMLTPRLPLNVVPGDSFTGNLVAANSTDKDLTFRLSIDSGEALQLKAGTPETITVRAGQEEVIPLNFVAGRQPEGASVRFSALQEDGSITTRSAGISLRPATHHRMTMWNGHSRNSRLIRQERELFNYEAQQSLTVSALPLPLMQGLSRYLESYPYDCLEQRISRAFGVVLLQKRAELLPEPEVRELLLQNALDGIRASLRYDGLRVWPESERGSLLLTAYAADLLLTMREQGMVVSEALIQQLCDNLSRNLYDVPPSLDDARAAAYAIWVLTREGRITTQFLESLSGTLDNCSSYWFRDLAATLFASSQRIMKMRQREICRFEEPVLEADHPWFDSLALQSLYTALIARYFPDRLTPDLINDFSANIMNSLNSGHYATFSSAQALRALTELYRASAPALDDVSLSCVRREGKGEVPLMESLSEGTVLTLNDPLCREFKLEIPEGSLPLFWQLNVSGFDRKTPVKAVSQGLSVQRVYRDREGREVNSVQQGEELTVTVTARADGHTVPDCVIVDLLPGGVEMLLPRANEVEELPSGVHMDRRDDRMLLFTDLGSEEFSFSYRVRAVNKGVFALPPVQAEAMYDRTIHANSAGGRFEIR